MCVVRKKTDMKPQKQNGGVSREKGLCLGGEGGA